MSAPFSRRAPHRFFFLWWFFILLVCVGVMRLYFSFAWWVCGIVVPQIATSILFIYDKLVAGTRWVRVPEKVLLVSSLPGPIGAYLSMQLVRHKTRKESFLWWWKALLLLEGILIVGLVFFLWRTEFFPDLPSLFNFWKW